MGQRVCYYSTLNTEAAVPSEMLVLVFQTTCCLIAEYLIHVLLLLEMKAVGRVA